MFDKKRYLITSALPYANGPLHIGHLCGAYLPADIFARFLRLMDKDVVFVCGSDEHGAAITTRAKKEGIEPQAIIDKYHASFEKTFQGIGISFDYYDRTSAGHHHQTSQDFFRTLYKQGSFIEQESEQYYDEQAEMFLADRYIIGTCPNCKNENAYGDQCENCGTALSPLELINPHSTVSGEKPVLKKTTHWYLPLNKHEDWLRTWITDPKLWKAHVVGQCKSWLDAGLQPRSMTRDLDWGVDVPSEIPGSAGKKLYVWLDAPIGYISSTQKWAEENGADWETYWKDDDSALIHFIGKDNIVFHCLIFPILLKEHGGYNLPINVPANQFLNLEGQKISTSRNWAIWVHEFVEDFPEWKAELRYYLIKNMPEQRDSEFLWKGFQEAVNNELVNNLANFINRVVVLTNKYYNGKVPEVDEDGYYDSELISLFDLMDSVCTRIRDFEFRAALQEVMQISAAGNQLLQFNEPWKAQKEDPEQVKVVMNLSLQFVTALSVLIRPFLPTASDKIRHLLNLPVIEEKEGESLIKTGHRINKPDHLFSRIDDDIIDAQVQKLKETAVVVDEEVVSTVPYKENISFDQFTQLDVRIGTIRSATKVPKTDKLLQIVVDLGSEVRTVVSGIALSYNAEDIAGQQVVLVTNLAPRKIKGILSQGMILMAEDADGQLKFVSPSEAVAAGSLVS
ncbi:UNVERIFIED_CONTAM: hypothetical protein GTU68_053565 [Idotea baltica]|nr:hypothetical protein [Idotea baltica]